jgi:SGNH domain (fused to AT3 domains)
LCRFGVPKTGRIDFVVWGDSHADAIAPAFRTLAVENGTSGWLAASPGCAPLLGVVRISRDISGCDQFNETVMSAIEQNEVPTVFLVGRWEVNAFGRSNREIAEGLGKVFLRDASSKETSPSETRAAFERGLTRTLSRLTRSHRSVVLMMDVPNTTIDTPVFLAKSAIRGRVGTELRIDITARGDRDVAMDDLLVRLSEPWHVRMIDPKRTLCRGSECLVAKDGRSLYRDDHHLTVFGAQQLVDLIRPNFDTTNPAE